MPATRRAILFKNLNYILREIYDILSEDALNYPVLVAALVDWSDRVSATRGGYYAVSVPTTCVSQLVSPLFSPRRV